MLIGSSTKAMLHHFYTWMPKLQVLAESLVVVVVVMVVVVALIRLEERLTISEEDL